MRSPISYGNPFAWKTRVPSTLPQAPTIASHGLTATSGRASMVRAPGFNSRMKHACRLSNRRCCDSPKSSSRSKNFQTAIENRVSSGLSMALYQPMKRVSRRRGMRLVSKKISCPRHAHERVSVLGLNSSNGALRRRDVVPAVRIEAPAGARNTLMPHIAQTEVVQEAIHDRLGVIERCAGDGAASHRLVPVWPLEMRDDSFGHVLDAVDEIAAAPVLEDVLRALTVVRQHRHPVRQRLEDDVAEGVESRRKDEQIETEIELGEALAIDPTKEARVRQRCLELRFGRPGAGDHH